MTESRPREKSTPVQNIVAAIEQGYENRAALMREAGSDFTWAAVVGGVATLGAISSAPLIAGLAAVATIYETTNGVISLSNIRDISRETAGLRQALAQHELATKEIHYTPNGVREEKEE